MYEYDDEVLDTFLKKQTQLFSEEVADTPEAAEEFLEDCMAVVCKNIKEVREILDFGASKAKKIASAKMEIIRDAVGLI